LKKAVGTKPIRDCIFDGASTSDDDLDALSWLPRLGDMTGNLARSREAGRGKETADGNENRSIHLFTSS
jgi:hypothetical protein